VYDITSGTNTIITGLSTGVTYYVWVKAQNSVGTSEFSPSASGTPTVSPAAPGMPNVTPGDRRLTVSWTAVVCATAYEVWFGTTNNSTQAARWGTDITSGTDPIITGLSAGVTYYVWVKAKNSDGTSGFSPSASGMPNIGYAEGITITLSMEDETIGGFPNSLTIYKLGDGSDPDYVRTLTITIPVNPDYTEYRWFVDGIQKGVSNSITLDAAQYPLGRHTVTAVVKKAGVYYSKEMAFTVVYE
jgi:hypothetical protein